MDYNKDEYNSILLQTMKAFIQICESQRITYFMFAGSLIGAIRHRGMIPWDDDIDVAMSRSDYDRLMAMRDNLPIQGYELLDFETYGYHLPFAKFSHTNSTIWEEREKECIFGVFVDIFPLDETGNDFKETECLHRKVKHLAYLYDCSMRKHHWGDFFSLIRKCNIREIKNFLLDICWRQFRKQRYLREYNAAINEAKQIRGENLVEINCMYPLRTQIFPKAWYTSVKSVPFEDFEVNVPIGYDQILRQVYGDYMQLPPIEKRISRHNCYYVDLSQRKTIEGIKRLLRGK